MKTCQIMPVSVYITVFFFLCFETFLCVVYAAVERFKSSKVQKNERLGLSYYITTSGLKADSDSWSPSGLTSQVTDRRGRRKYRPQRSGKPFERGGNYRDRFRYYPCLFFSRLVLRTAPVFRLFSLLLSI